MGQNKERVFVHFVWATRDRLPLITEAIERELCRYIHQVCGDDGGELLAIGGMADHLHLLVKMPLTLSCSDLMKHVKGGSSRLISTDLKPGEWFAWQASYGAFSVSCRDLKTVKRYINAQKQHHQADTLWREAEQSAVEHAPAKAVA